MKKVYIKLRGEGELRPPVYKIEYKGYVVTQDLVNHHVMIFKDGRRKMHSQCSKPMIDYELRQLVDDYLRIIGQLDAVYDDDREESGLLEEE